MADIFVSYTSSDRDWAFWVGQELEKLGHTPRIHEWEIKGSVDIYAWMEKHHDAADHVLCVISDEYLLAPYSTLERNAALWQAASKRPGFVLFVVVKPCRIPTLSDHIRRCTLHGLAEDEARTRFVEFMAPPGRPPGPMPFPGIASSPSSTKAPVAFPGGPHALSNIPIAVPLHFLGREEELKGIKTALARGAGRVAITALHGLRGVGKTTLAAAYAERHRSDYRATWWIRAQTESTMRADLVALGVRLGCVAAEEKEEVALSIVMEQLRNGGDGILLVYDNAIDEKSIGPYLPRAGTAQIIVTSNSDAWRRVAAPVEIEVWPKEIGADYLIARTGRQAEGAMAVTLSAALGGLPLAHEQAAAYCERLKISLADYLRHFDATPAKLMDDKRDAAPEYHDGMTVAKTFALAIDEAAKLHPAAESLIVHAALLAPEPIPMFLFKDGREEFDEPFASNLAGDGLDEMIAALRGFALIDRETIVDERDPTITTDCIRLHRLVRQVVAARQDNEVRIGILRRLIKAVARVYPRRAFDDPKMWPSARRLDAIAFALVTEDAVILPGNENLISDLLDRLASYRHGALASYDQAKPLFERAESILAADSPDRGTRLSNLAGLLFNQGNLGEAKALYARAQTLLETTKGQEHLETAMNLNNLAQVLQAQGDLVGAQLLMERALAVHETRAGLEHADTATCLNNLGVLAVSRGDVVSARSHIERALAIWQKVAGADHPNTNRARGNLARILLAADRPAEAVVLAEKALTGHDAVLGSQHPWTILSANIMADALSAQGRIGEAATIREKYERGMPTAKE